MRSSGSLMDLEAAQGLHRRDATVHMQRPAAGGGSGARRRLPGGRLAGRARTLLSDRWRLIALLVAALMVSGAGCMCAGPRRPRPAGAPRLAAQPPQTAAASGRSSPPAAAARTPPPAHPPPAPPPRSCTR